MHICGEVELNIDYLKFPTNLSGTNELTLHLPQVHGDVWQGLPLPPQPCLRLHHPLHHDALLRNPRVAIPRRHWLPPENPRCGTWWASGARILPTAVEWGVRWRMDHKIRLVLPLGQTQKLEIGRGYYYCIVVIYLWAGEGLLHISIVFMISMA